MDADGGNRQVLRAIEPVIHSVAWSPDGSTLAISAATAVQPGDVPQHGLFLLPASGKGKLRLFRANAWTPSWSPDGTRLAFTVEHPRGRWRVYTARIDGTEETAFGDAWSPDGRQIAFDRFAVGGGRQQVFVMNADGSGTRQLTTDPAWSCAHPSWSQDGRRLAVSCRSAASPRGMGVFSTGHKMPECTRRVFTVAAEPGSPKVKIFDHDGAGANFWSVPR
jgi:TolB protein